MNCERTEKISQLIDGELPPAEAREVERHLVDCLECREAQLDFLNLRSQIGAYATSLDAARQRQALANILSQPRNVPAPVPQLQPRRLRFSFGFSPAWAAVAALVLFAVLVSLALYRSRQHVLPIAPERQAQQQPPAPRSPETPRVLAPPENKEPVIAKAPDSKRNEIRGSQAKVVEVNQTH
jgi:anti-sigma factor RsiW